MQDRDLKQAVHLAAEVTNRDVTGLAFEDSALMMNSTWKPLLG